VQKRRRDLEDVGEQAPVIDAVADQAFAEVARSMNLQLTSGSTSVRITSQFGMRVVGAAARPMLVEAAARRWQVPAEAIVTTAGEASHPASDRSVTYAELAPEAAHLRVPANPRLKSARDLKLIGTSPPRRDIPAKATGEAKYRIHVRLTDMRYATVKAAPVHGGRLVALEMTRVTARKDIERVVTLDDAIAVIARSCRSACKALVSLAPTFSDGGNGSVSTASIFQQHDGGLRGEGSSQLARGDAPAVLAAVPPALHIEATYRVPFLHHAALEPINAVAQLAYRPQVSTQIAAALGADGKPNAWSQVYVEGSPSEVTAFEIPYNPEPVDPLSKMSLSDSARFLAQREQLAARFQDPRDAIPLNTGGHSYLEIRANDECSRRQRSARAGDRRCRLVLGVELRLWQVLARSSPSGGSGHVSGP
jgi:hypothetical protein